MDELTEDDWGRLNAGLAVIQHLDLAQRAAAYFCPPDNPARRLVRECREALVGELDHAAELDRQAIQKAEVELRGDDDTDEEN